MIMRSLCCAVAALLIGSSASQAANNPALSSITGKTCKIGFIGTGPKATGAAWLEVDKADPNKARYWRKWGDDAYKNFAPAVRDSGYESLGEVVLVSNADNTIGFVVAMTFNWTLTPTGTPGEFTTKVVGGQSGTTGKATCS